MLFCDILRALSVTSWALGVCVFPFLCQHIIWKVSQRGINYPACQFLPCAVLGVKIIDFGSGEQEKCKWAAVYEATEVRTTTAARPHLGFTRSCFEITNYNKQIALQPTLLSRQRGENARLWCSPATVRTLQLFQRTAPLKEQLWKVY